jgi:putative ABC transport system permease protein
LAPGGRVRIKDYVYTVVGVLAPMPYTAFDPTNFNDAVQIPLTGGGRFMPTDQPETVLMRMRPDADVKAAGVRISAALANPTSTLQVISARDLIDGMNAQKAIHTRLLTAIGAISLLVGGIGVMNVMLMGVMERRREIGLRAAIGATPRDLQMMFLIEAAVLAFVGGVAGLLFGLAAAFVVAQVSGWVFSLPLYVLLLGPGMAALVGITFGFYPALKASRLDPIEALRAE